MNNKTLVLQPSTHAKRAHELKIRKGTPKARGFQRAARWWHFGLPVKKNARIKAEIYLGPFDEQPTYSVVVPFTTDGGKQVDVHHMQLKGLEHPFYVRWWVGTPGADGRITDWQPFLNPYARALMGKIVWSEGRPTFPLECVTATRFNWYGHERSVTDTPLPQGLIYEALVWGMTAHPSSGMDAQSGKLEGLVPKLDHLAALGVTHLNLMPIGEAPNRDNPRLPEHYWNCWGYMSEAFAAVNHSLSGLGPLGSPASLMFVVRECHKRGIKVILDLVFNHTYINVLEPIWPFAYFRNGDGSHDGSFTGCGNTVNCNHPVVRELILHTLKYFHKVCGVDGFRFDLAAVFALDADGVHRRTELLHEMENSGDLITADLIAEPWHCRHGALDGGIFHDPRWARWTERKKVFFDAIRSVSGWHNKYADMIARRSGEVVYATCHDGATLWDTVAYDHKENLGNGENNQDGPDDSHMYGHGWHGELPADMDEDRRRAIHSLRIKQSMNVITMLMAVRDVVQLLYGDEGLRTQLGNTNAVFRPDLVQVDWHRMRCHAFMQTLIAKLTEIRKRHLVRFDRRVAFHGLTPNEPEWAGWNNFLAWSWERIGESELPEGMDEVVRAELLALPELFAAANMHWEGHTVHLPALPEGWSWHRIVDTAQANPTEESFVGNETYEMHPRSVVMLEARKNA